MSDYTILESRQTSDEEVQRCSELVQAIGKHTNANSLFTHENNWCGPQGDSIYGKLFNTCVEDMDAIFFNALRKHCGYFTGWNIDSLESGDVENAWIKTFKNHYAKEGENTYQWNRRSFIAGAEGMPKRLFFDAPLVCGERGFDVDGRCVNCDTIGYQHRVNAIFQHGIIDDLNACSEPVIVEIGGGYGALAEYLKRHVSDATYVIVDLPRSLMISGSYLSIAQPETEVVFLKPGDAVVPQAINLVIADEYKEVLEAIECDCVLNTMSFSEMNAEVVVDYARFFKDRFTPDGFLHEQNVNCAHYDPSRFCNTGEVLETVFDHCEKNLNFRYLTGMSRKWR